MIHVGKESFDLRWLIILPLLAVVIVAAVLINNNIGYTPESQVVLDIDNGDLNIDWNKLETYNIELSDGLHITRPGTYNISGSLVDKGIVVDVTQGYVKLVLKNVRIKNTTGPAISCTAADKLVIESIGENYLEDGKTRSENTDTDGAIYSKADLVFTGSGLLKVISNYQDGIVSKDDIVIRSGTYDVVAVDDGIRGKDSVFIVGGSIAIDSKADGIKSTNETDADKGFVYIKDGELTINAGDDGIHAKNELIIDDGTIEIAKSYEGLEGTKITINNGNIKIKSSDDGINAGSGTSESNTPRPNPINDADKNCIIYINGGNLYINAAGDGIDSNGYAYINGGQIIVDGPANGGNGALDAGAGLFLNGGEVIAVGSSDMAEGFSNNSKAYSVNIFLNETYKAGTVIKLKNKEGEVILEHTAAKKFSSIILASSDFDFGEEYTLYLDGQKYRDISIADITTTVGTKPRQPRF